MAAVFNISEKVSLALHSMVLITTFEKELMSVNEIAKKIDCSKAHLSKVLQQLAKAGFLYSLRGPKGGFALLKKPEDINLLEIYESIEGPIEITGCPTNNVSCPFDQCIFNGIPEQLNNQFVDFLKNKKLSDFLENLKQNKISIV